VVVAVAAVTWFTVLRDRSDVSRSAEQSKPIAVSATPIVAVLPFANQTGDDSQDYFADGVTEEVISALGRFNTLRVIGRNAVLRYKKRPPTQEEIASDLGATYLATGSVSRSDKHVRITAQLTEARAGTVMWNDRYDGDIPDIFDFQDAIERQIWGTMADNIALVAEGRLAKQSLI
jgi:adenylate cyclase